MSTKTDLVLVIDRAALIENLIDQVIEGFCAPRDRTPHFFWNVVLDSSIMPFASKAKVVMAIAQELNVKLDQNAIHSVLSLRNAFAHHQTNSHPVISIRRKPEPSEVHFELKVISNSGRISRKRRDEALSEFDASYEVAKECLIALVTTIRSLDASSAVKPPLRNKE